MASIQYSDVTDIVPLPVDAQDVVTKVHLVVAGNRAGWEPVKHYSTFVNTPDPNEPTTPIPEPITYTLEDANHATYRCERAFDLPSGVEPFLDSTDDAVGEPFTVLGLTNAGSPSAIRDGDPATYATSDLSDTTRVRWTDWLNKPNHYLYGFKLKYTFVKDGAGSTFATDSAPGLLRLTQRTVRSVSGTIQVGYVWPIHPTGDDHDEPQDVYGIAPFDARGSEANNEGETVTDYSFLDLTVLQQSGGGELRIYEFYPLMLDTTLLQDIAERNVKLPASEPKRVTVRGYVAPDREHTIVGWPGGDFTGVVAQHQYELGRTVIDFEQAGAPTGLSAVSMQEARRQQVAVDRAVQKALYPVRMGERQ